MAMNATVSAEVESGGVGAILGSLRALGSARLAAMGIVSFAMLCMLALLFVRGGGDGRMALLYGDLDLREAAQMADLLDKAHVPHSLSGQGDQILVPEADVAAARLLLAKASLPTGGSIGDEIFDRGESLTASPFEQEINRTRALEGELARSIRMIEGVRGARVHLVLPHRDLFATETNAAQASVLLTMRGSIRLDAEAVQAILNLVSAAVPGLKPQAIAIIDNRGDVLARAGSPTDAAGVQGGQSLDEQRQAMELRLSRDVEEMLDATLGPDKVRAEAAVTFDTSEVNETAETYDPDQQVLRSQQTTTDKSRNTEAQPATTVANNLPNADAGAPRSGSQEDRSSETSNYEIGKTVRTKVDTAPRLRRLSLAVLVDGTTTLGPQGQAIWTPRSSEELARITALVKSAVGYDEKRGDMVTVETMRFTLPESDRGGDEERTPFGLGISAPDLTRLAQTGLLALAAIAASLFVFRPMISRLVPRTAVAATPLLGTAVATGIAGGPAADTSRALVTIADARTGPRMLPAPEDAGMTRLDHVEGEVETQSLTQLADLVDRYPEESLALVRAWLGEEGA